MASSKKGSKKAPKEPVETQAVPTDEAADTTAPEEPAELPVERKARLVNLKDRAVYVPLAGGPVRVGPKQAIEVSEKDVSDLTRQAQVDGRIVINIL